MGTKREISVNGLDRYTKSSERLVLEEYSSCEVPAGCGGGILRWIDPHEALPLQLRLWTTGEAEVFFDGRKSTSGRIDAGPGPHVLAIHVTPRDGRRPQVAFSLLYSDAKKPEDGFGPARSASIGQKVSVLSGVGSTLLATSAAPAGDAWTQPGFDAAGWSPLAVVTAHVPDDQRDWQLDFVKKTGPHVMGLPGASGPLWLRCTFEIALPAPARGAP